MVSFTGFVIDRRSGNMMRSRRSLIGLLIVTLACAACTSKHLTPPAVRGWTRSDLKPVTQPAPIGDRFVLYSADGGQLSVTALDARTGKTVWTDTATTSGIAAGEGPTLTIAGRNVIYVHDGGQGLAQITAAAAADGHVI